MMMMRRKSDISIRRIKCGGRGRAGVEDDDSIRYVSPASRVRESMMMRLMRESGINVT